MLLLLERAEQTQTAVLQELRDLESRGLASNIEVKWLTNSIGVDLAPSQVSQIASHPDVIDTYEPPVLQPMEPVFRKDAPSHSMGSTGGAEDNLRFIGADSAWKMGYTGEGRVVCHLDDVDGNHPALYGNWKGHDGDSGAAWSGSGSFPTAHKDFDHGTLVMGIMVGHDDLSGDTIGVAPGAEWIAGHWTHWDWAANPDGNPNTTADVPDAIALTKDHGMSCWDLYWEQIDMVEALGTVVVVSAGNRGGGGSMTVATPASRALDSLTNFAVGSCHHVDGIVSAFSSRGPSTCDSVSIKPNIVAPGGWVRTSTLNGEYKFTGGTSMSAPHVAGAVAILRQYAPNSTANEIKEALLAGCTPAGSPVPNNDYGWGIINIPASLGFLSPESRADIRLRSFNYEPTAVDDTLFATMVIKNRGVRMDSVYAVFLDSYVGLRVLNDSISFGDLVVNDTASGAALLRIVFDDTLLAGPKIPVDFEFHGVDGQVSPCTLTVRAGVEGERVLFTHKNEILQFTVSNVGAYGFASDYYDPDGCCGFRYGDTTRNWLKGAALMLGTDSVHVSDGFYDEERDPDDDFWFDAASIFDACATGWAADQETYTIFSDGRAEDRIGLEVLQRSYSWFADADRSYVVLEYVISNVTDQPINELFVGLCFHWALGNGYQSGFSVDQDLGYLRCNVPGSSALKTSGLSVLNAEGACSYTAFPHIETGYPWKAAMSEYDKFSALSGGFVDIDYQANSHETIIHILSTGPFTLQPGECDTAAFAVIGADSLSEMKATALRAKEKWQGIVNTYAKPERFWLGQNYPNPFNSLTTISFTMLDPARVTLDVYNILGQRVETILDRHVLSGRWTASWDATDYASGIYFVSMTIGESSQSMKMLLLK